MATMSTIGKSSNDEFNDNEDHCSRQHQKSMKHRHLLMVGAGVALVGFAAAVGALVLSEDDVASAIIDNVVDGVDDVDRGMPSYRHRRVREHHHKHHQEQKNKEREEEELFDEEWSHYHIPFGEDVATTDGPPVHKESVTPSPEIPPLAELVENEEVKGDISWMVDFAIIGNPKCGTTFLMVSSAHCDLRQRAYILTCSS